MAMSVPEAIAIPTSAYISAGASFIPSPITTTFFILIDLLILYSKAFAIG